MKTASVPRYGPPRVITNSDYPRSERGPGQLPVRKRALAWVIGDAPIREGKVQLQSLSDDGSVLWLEEARLAHEMPGGATGKREGIEISIEV